MKIKTITLHGNVLAHCLIANKLEGIQKSTSISSHEVH